MGINQSSNTQDIDISSYLTEDQANEIYQVKPPSDDEFVLKTYADDTYKFPEDYISKNELSAYLLEDKAKRLYQELPPKGDQFVLKSYTDQLYKLSSNYASVDELNKYITQSTANSIYQPKGSYLTQDSSNGGLTIKNNGAANNSYSIRGTDSSGNPYFLINNVSGNTNWNQTAGSLIVNANQVINGNQTVNGDTITKNKNNFIVRDIDDSWMNGFVFQKLKPAGIKGGNELGYISFEGTDNTNVSRRGSLILSNSEGDFTSTSAPSSLKFSTTPVGSTTAIDRMIITSNGNIVIPNKGSLVIPDSGGVYGAGNGSYIYNNGDTLNIQMRNGGNGRIELKAGSKTISFDMNGKLCFGPGKCITADTPGISWSS
jgi:hypothetical protein